ncbi:phospholipase D-like domain-containing protein [Candidatus Carsonella ruddii]|uniref:phospholipase D-like domain-containing protein n=1 Tax=Carsonella ruddii TaxID=114186 RepID=UPI003D43EF2E
MKLLFYKSIICFVFIILDRIGSININIKIKNFLCFFFNKKKILINVRNHKKIIFIDNNLLWIGGNNIGMDYLGMNIIIGKWRDFHCKIINFSFNYVNKNLFIKNNFLIKKLLFSKKNFFLESNFFKLIKYIFKRIQKTIVIISPYLIIDLQIINIIKNININIAIYLFLSYKSDNLYIQNTSIIFVKFLKKKNIKIYLLCLGFFHKKIYIFDKKYILFGSINFDIRSNYFNKENLFIIKDNIFRNIFFKKIKKEKIFLYNINYKKKFFYLKFFYIISFLNYFLQ